MGSQNLGVPGASFPSVGSQQRISTSSQGGRNKVLLKPGHSLMDWIKLGRSGQDLTGGGRCQDVTMEELKKHNQEGDAWLALRGKVYNVTPYLDFHPGGVEELMRGAGKDGTALFDEVHKWVNAESMLEKCYIGKLKMDNPMLRSTLLNNESKMKLKDGVANGQIPTQFLIPSTPPMQTPRFDWYQSSTSVSVVVYTKWTGMQKAFVITDKEDTSLFITMYIKQSVYFVHLDLESDVEDDFQINISADSGKVELLFQKSVTDVQWSVIGKQLDRHNQYIKYSEYNPAYRDCTIEKVESVTKDTNLYTICLPSTYRMSVPLGYHVHIKHNISGMDVVRSYTAVLPSLERDSQDSRVHEGRAFHLMIKTYKDGALTPWINSLKSGDNMSVSCIDGNFDSSRLRESTHLVMFAAGTGFTPMVKLLYHTLVQEQDSTRQVKLLFFNKTESDIVWNDQLCALAAAENRFVYTNCLSEADNSWTGLRGRVTKEMVEEFLPQTEENDKLLICVCGPTPFTKSAIQYAEELGHKDSTHAFLG